MTRCPYCLRHVWPFWAIIAATVLFLAADAGKGALIWTVARHYEQAVGAERRAQSWEKIADGMMQRDVKRQVEATHGRKP